MKGLSTGGRKYWSVPIMLGQRKFRLVSKGIGLRNSQRLVGLKHWVIENAGIVSSSIITILLGFFH